MPRPTPQDVQKEMGEILKEQLKRQYLPPTSLESEDENRRMQEMVQADPQGNQQNSAVG